MPQAIELINMLKARDKDALRDYFTEMFTEVEKKCDAMWKKAGEKKRPVGLDDVLNNKLFKSTSDNFVDTIQRDLSLTEFFELKQIVDETMDAFSADLRVATIVDNGKALTILGPLQDGLLKVSKKIAQEKPDESRKIQREVEERRKIQREMEEKQQQIIEQLENEYIKIMELRKAQGEKNGKVFDAYTNDNLSRRAKKIQNAIQILTVANDEQQMLIVLKNLDRELGETFSGKPNKAQGELGKMLHGNHGLIHSVESSLLMHKATNHKL
jgi:hypothetical protein